MTQDDVLIQLERCERSNRHLRIILIAGAIVIAGVSLLGLSTTQDQSEVVETLQVRELVVVDDQDVVRVRIGGHLPDAEIDGKPVPRGQDAAGILLYDDGG